MMLRCSRYGTGHARVQASLHCRCAVHSTVRGVRQRLAVHANRRNFWSSRGSWSLRCNAQHSGTDVGVSGLSNRASQEEEEKAKAIKIEISKLEAERAEVVSVAEACAKTSAGVSSMIDMLSEVAIKKLRQGDEQGARQVLEEKAKAVDVKAKSESRAGVNYQLAMKLGEAIASHSAAGKKQTELASLAAKQTSASRALADNHDETLEYPKVPSTSVPTNQQDTYARKKLPWEVQLEEARQRIQEQQREASSQLNWATIDAEQSIDEALERIHSKRGEDILAAKDRLRKTAEYSIGEARERIRAKERENLKYLRDLVQRKARGQYVSDDEMDFAFRQIQKGW